MVHPIRNDSRNTLTEVSDSSNASSRSESTERSEPGSHGRASLRQQRGPEGRVRNRFTQSLNRSARSGGSNGSLPSSARTDLLDVGSLTPGGANQRVHDLRDEIERTQSEIEKLQAKMEKNKAEAERLADAEDQMRVKECESRLRALEAFCQMLKQGEQAALRLIS